MKNRMRLALAVLLAVAPPAQADPPKAPCAKCTLHVPATDDAVPLLVVLHGDRERATTAAARWRVEAVRQGFAVLALECPASEGCKGSWWQWNGDPQWIRDQIAAVSEQRAIDDTRVYGVGWSGGATYLGMRAPAWADTFAALVIHGGGMAPSDSACGTRTAPSYFLVGDKNPLHHLAVGLRDYAEACGTKPVWDLVRGAAHAGEARALTRKKARTILAWLADQRRVTK